MSPDCSTAKRLSVEVWMKVTLEASPNTAAAMLRQYSMSMPCSTPWASGAPEPGVSFSVPQRSVPRARTVSRVVAWAAGRAAAPASRAARTGRMAARRMAHSGGDGTHCTMPGRAASMTECVVPGQIRCLGRGCACGVGGVPRTLTALRAPRQGSGPARSIAMVQPRFLSFNGRIVPFDEARVHVLTPGLKYGAGVFEGIRGYWNGERGEMYLFRLAEHLDRLQYSMRVMRYDHAPTSEAVAAAVVDVVRANALREDVHIRPMAWVDGDGEMLATGPVGWMVAALPRPFNPQVRDGVHVGTSSWRRIADTAMPARVKATANYVNGRLAGIAGKADGYDNVLLLTQAGHVAESPGSCFFMVRHGRPVTPGTTSSILESVTRATVMGLAGRAGGGADGGAGHRPDGGVRGGRGVLLRLRAGDPADPEPGPAPRGRRQAGAADPAAAGAVLRAGARADQRPCGVADAGVPGAGGPPGAGGRGRLTRAMAAPRRMHLAFNLSYTHMNGRWRLPGAWDARTFPDVTLYEDAARLAERGLLDMLFSGDGTGVPDTWGGSRDAAVHWGVMYPRVDMNPVMVAAARVTRHIGFGLTYSTTFMHPYYLARLMTSLDLLTGGRVAMNLVTSTRRSDAANFGFDALMEHGSRYDRMEEFVAVCRALWDATDADAMVWDGGSGQVADPAKVRDVDHAGRFFQVQGPLNTPPSPQGRPVIVQAGGSPRGIRASAAVADHVFGADMPLAQQVAQRAELDAALEAVGRDPAGVGVLWQTPMAVRETAREAQATRDLLLTSLTPEGAAVYLSYHAGYDLSTLPARFTLRELRTAIAAAQASPMGLVFKLALKLGEDTEISRAEFFEHGLLAATQYENTVAGTPAAIADILEERFEATGSRGGFMIGQSIAVLADLAATVELLVPELQRRGAVPDGVPWGNVAGEPGGGLRGRSVPPCPGLARGWGSVL